MSFVEYYLKDGQKTFNCALAVKNGWGIEWGSDLIGIRLQDRKNPIHIVEISKTHWMIGVFIIYFKEGGWQCLDHCIEQFKILESN